MDISLYLENINSDIIDIYAPGTLGQVIKLCEKSEDFLNLGSFQLAILGVPEERGAFSNMGCSKAPNAIRSALYKLYSGDYNCKIADLGNIKKGNSLKDTHSALTEICSLLLRENVIPIIIGGSQDLAYSQYLSYKALNHTINVVTIDALFDLGVAEDTISSRNYVGKIILQQPNFLFNLSNIGYQTYFVGKDSIQLMEKLYFDAYRLAQVKENIEEAEPIVRNADMLSFDVSAVRKSDAPGNENSSPNGFYGEEVCQIMRYAGMSDKMSSIGFYETNPDFDLQNQTSSLVAQMIWCFIDGFYNRRKDSPIASKAGFTKYRIDIKNTDHEIIFYKSKKTNRWWMEVPYLENKIKFQRHHFIPCSYSDYQTACNNGIPERWW